VAVFVFDQHRPGSQARTHAPAAVCQKFERTHSRRSTRSRRSRGTQTVQAMHTLDAILSIGEISSIDSNG
jgi:hypothetical protein